MWGAGDREHQGMSHVTFYSWIKKLSGFLREKVRVKNDLKNERTPCLASEGSYVSYYEAFI